jgi:hypothetical protein
MVLLAATSLCAILLSTDPAIARYDDLWTRRDDALAAAEIASMSKQFAASNDYDELWRAARWYHWVADGAPNDDERKALGKTGWDVGEKAKQINPAGVEGKYWTSVDIGAYSEAVGVITALAQGLESKFRDPIMEVIAADPGSQNPNLDYVGPEMAIGRYYYKLPWPKHSDSKSKEWLNRAIKTRPDNLLAHYYLADTLKDHDAEAARREIGIILAGSEAFDPPLARRVKRWAMRLATRITE